MAVDELAGIVAWLASRSAVSTLCNGHVYGDELPDADDLLPSEMPFKCVVIHDAGIGSLVGRASMLPIGSTRKDIKCYGETPAEAREVWNACYTELKNMIRTTAAGVRLYSAVVGAPTAMREPEEDWPFVFGSFDLLAAEED